MTEQRKGRLKRQLQESRYRLRSLNSEFAEPLDEMLFVADESVRRMTTNGSCIYFDPDWLQRLGNTELDFMISHQLMHITLGHIDRPKYYVGARFHLACDIVANSHLELLGWRYEKLSNVGKIYCETFFPAKVGRTLTAQEALECVPFDPATIKGAAGLKYTIDSEEMWDLKDDRGERGVIVLSPEDEDPEDLKQEDPNTGGRRLFVQKQLQRDEKVVISLNENGQSEQGSSQSSWDKSVAEEIESLRNTKKHDKENGIDVDFVERIWQRVNTSKIDWRKLLCSFIQEEVCDYSFTPPDKRLYESDFFLPDYNVTVETPKNIWFFVDTSGSIDDDMLSTVYGEICNAILQFNGGIEGILCFFDKRVYKPIRFSDVRDLLGVKPLGGGGTSFNVIFESIKSEAFNDPPSSIIIFTDGEAEFPSETVADNIPVLWLLLNERVIPPWGKLAYVK